DGGALLLREVEAKTGLLAGVAEQFTDYRDPEQTEHSVGELVSQRIIALALGYEDLNDHDRLRFDPLLAVAAGKADPMGKRRRREQDRGKALASSSTLNRLELTPADADREARYKKIVADQAGLDRQLVKHFIQSHARAPRELWLDLDATDDPLHGHQEGRFFHGYYGHYCYLPLYITCGEHVLCARLRQSNIDAADGSVEELTRIVAQLRAAWPKVRIIIRGDSGFCREEIMAWCEAEGVEFVLGLAKNNRLNALSLRWRIEAQQAFLETCEPSRVFGELKYRTLKTWSRGRRVVVKAEHLAKGANPRYVVTSLNPKEADARTLYEDLYCARGDMENRIKEQQLELFADRLSAQTMRANQLRLTLSTLAYTLLVALRNLALQDTELERATPGNIRTRLLKVGAQVRVSVRRVVVALSEAFPAQDIFVQAARNLAVVPAYVGPG
uniref:IS1380 family transposase n=1 Tax=Thiohalocapsa sp. TaxID=2497641 RepID=UPI0025F37E0B